jgi:tetratricopeptide (TPR) repeat protein
MTIFRWVSARLSGRRNEGDSLVHLHGLLQEAHAHLQLEDYDKARAPLLQVLLSRDSIREPETIDYALMSLGSTWLLTGQYADGISFFSEYLSRYPEDSAAYRERASALWYAGRFEGAIGDYSRALELKPTDILSLSGRGQVLAESGEYARAMVDLDLALSSLKNTSMPNASWAEWYKQIEAFVHSGKGLALAGLGEKGPAFDEFEVSINLSPENAWVFHNRAQVYDLAGDRKKACTDYQMALAKKKPLLSPIRAKQAQARFRELSNQP